MEKAMVNQARQRAANSWTTRRDEKRRRLESVRPWMQGPILSQEKIIDALELLLQSGDRVVLEGDNQKQADFLSRSLVNVNPQKLQDLHLIISSISRPEHLTLFELGIAKKVDFSFAGPQRSEHGRYACHCRSRGVSRRHRDRAGQ
jgi:malonate decarboxylase alpha subunit